MYDVIIAGASFAGLAVANQLKGYKVLLLDRKSIGTGQTSACGTMLRVLEHWDLTDAVLQVHDRFVLHTGRMNIEFPSPYPWCTFDYTRLCKTLFERSGAEFLQATVRGTTDNQVQTSKGSLKARYIVDATGWRGALVSRLNFHRTKKGMNFGVESILTLPGGNGFNPEALHFWYDPVILRGGVGWAFPRGDEVSIGVGSYGRAKKMRPALRRMTNRLGTTYDDIHGTYFPYKLLSPTAGSIFVVGDAAGMCLALTGEGIRPAMFFGEACGRIIRRGLDDGLTVKRSLEDYSTFVRPRRIFFDFFTTVQETLTRLPLRAVDWIARAVSRKWLRSWMFDEYWGLTKSWGENPDLSIDRSGRPMDRRVEDISLGEKVAYGACETREG